MNPRFTHIRNWTLTNIELWDQEDNEYVVYPSVMDDLPGELEEHSGFEEGDRMVLNLYDGEWDIYAEREPERVLWLINHYFAVNPDKFNYYILKL